MGIEQLRMSMKGILSDSRYNHSIGVEEVCYDLALIYGYDTIKASIAGILHDCAKYLTSEELIQECEGYKVTISETERKLPHLLLHAKLGAIYARERHGITDESILKAIEFHTTGRPGMSILEKIVYVADFIEPNRKDNIPKMDVIREVAYQDLDKAVILILDNTLKYLNENEMLIEPITKETYKYYVNMK
jgi:nicotinate-nucleotide adenylyltransferase